MENELIIPKVKERIHPQKMYLWVGLGSIVMMFAGLTSAHIVKKGQANWLEFDFPKVFFISTLVILLSSYTIQMALKKYKEKNQEAYRSFISISSFLGLLFIALQIRGFLDLNSSNVALVGAKSNSAASFLFVIVGLHLLHVLAGVIALLIFRFKAKSVRNKMDNVLSVDLISTYWHFVDILWIYLLVFLYFLG